MPMETLTIELWNSLGVPVAMYRYHQKKPKNPQKQNNLAI